MKIKKHKSLRDIHYGSTYFVLCGKEGLILTSTDWAKVGCSKCVRLRPLTKVQEKPKSDGEVWKDIYEQKETRPRH